MALLRGAKTRTDSGILDSRVECARSYGEWPRMKSPFTWEGLKDPFLRRSFRRWIRRRKLLEVFELLEKFVEGFSVYPEIGGCEFVVCVIEVRKGTRLGGVEKLSGRAKGANIASDGGLTAGLFIDEQNIRIKFSSEADGGSFAIVDVGNDFERCWGLIR